MVCLGGLCPEGVHNRPPQDVPRSHVDYFELQAIKSLPAHEKLLPLKEFKLGALPIMILPEITFMTYLYSRANI